MNDLGLTYNIHGNNGALLLPSQMGQIGVTSTVLPIHTEWFANFVAGEAGRYPHDGLGVQEEHKLEWPEDEVELGEGKYDIYEGDQGGRWVHVLPCGCNH